MEVGLRFWKGKKVFLTGHTGFKGGWLALWLQRLGARVFGYSLPAPTSPSLFEIAGISRSTDGAIADIRELPRLIAAIREFSPDIVFHLAAQPLVGMSYTDPVGTYSTNLLGTVHVLEAIRNAKSVRSAVMVTTDKCYENMEREHGYREDDRLGGHDPYSNSKACAELAIDSYRRSFFGGEDAAGIASGRAGNVVGGGDWARDRLLPDLMRAATTGQTLVLRNPKSTRPWQHVLEPLRGYLMLAAALWDSTPGSEGPWNFGPLDGDTRTVEEIVAIAARAWGGDLKYRVSFDAHPHEARLLKLDCAKAVGLGWRPVLDAEQSVIWAVDWYKAWRDGQNMKVFSLNQIELYEKLLAGQAK